MYDVTLWTGTSNKYVTLGRQGRRHQKCANDKNVVPALTGLMRYQRTRNQALCIVSPIQLYSINSNQFSSVQFISVQFNSIQFNSIQFNSLHFNSIQQFNSIQFSMIQFFKKLAKYISVHLTQNIKKPYSDLTHKHLK